MPRPTTSREQASTRTARSQIARAASRRRVKQLVDRTERQLLKSWATLDSMRKGTATRDMILDFQGALATTLKDLGEGYVSLANARRELILRKNSLNALWFVARQRLLGQLQRTLRQCISIARVLGDAFAWFFYQNSREFLAVHRSHPIADSLPTGTGGSGEVEFARQAKFLGPFFVLHHTVTSMLRVGDISLVDLKSLTVSGLGELKTERVDDNQLLIKASLFSGRRLDLGLARDPATTTSAGSEMSSAMAARVRRQMGRLSRAVSEAGKTLPRIKIALNADTYAKEYAQFLSRRDQRRTTFSKISDALVLGVVPMRGRRLFSRLLVQTYRGLAGELEDLPRVTTELLRRDLRHNSLVIETLLYDDDGEARSIPGTIPMFWWFAVEPELMRSVVFMEALVVSIYNPGHFLAKLEAEGFSVTAETKEHPSYLIEKRVDDRVMRLQGADYYIGLACRYLWREDALIQLIRASLEQTQGVESNTRVDLRFEHRLLRPEGARHSTS